MDDKIRARRRSLNRERGRRRVSWMVPLVLVVCAGVCFLWLRSTDVFAVRAVLVNETERVTRDDIAGVADGVFGESLLTLSTGEVEEALLTLPYVCFAEVHRRFPDKLEVTVLEYDPVARLQVRGGGVWLVSLDGRLLEGADASRFAHLPLVVPDASFSPVAGGFVPDAVAGALATAVLLQEDVLRERLPAVERVSASDVGDVVVAVAGGTELRLGEPVELEEKLTRAAQILADCLAEGKELEYVDASVPDRVAVKPK